MTSRDGRLLAAAALVALFAIAGIESAASEASRASIRALDSSIREGVRVGVKGEIVDGVLFAEEIEIRDDDDDDDDEIRGNIESLNPARGTFTLLGVEVRTDSSTLFSREPASPASFADLAPDVRVKVDGRRQPAGHFVAEKVRIRENQRYRERRVVGAIAALVPSDRGLAEIEVAGFRVLIGADTALEGGRGKTRPIVRRRLGQIDDDDDLLFGSGGLAGGRIALAGEIRLRTEKLSNLDFNLSAEDAEGEVQAEKKGDELTPEVTGILGAAVDLGPVFAYAEVVAAQEFRLESERPFDSSDGDARIGEAYVEARGFGVPWLAVAVGRQKFNEEREWHYNRKNLDSIRLLADFGHTSVEASVGRDLFDESRNLRDQDLVNTFVQVRSEIVDDVELEAYYLDRDDRTELDDSPRIVGLRLLAEAGRHVEAWIDLARETGTVCTRQTTIDLDGDGADDDVVDGGRLCTRDDPNDPDDPLVRDLRAHAYDAGLTYRPRVRLDPTFTLSYAFGSGEPDYLLETPEQAQNPSSSKTFRQSGLHRNRWKFNGVVSFRYYGEVLDPELMNLGILTAGVGLRPARSFSVDVLYHSYRQDEPSRRFHDFDIDEQPSGVNPDIGDEWDLILGYEPGRRIELRLTAGLFRPGGAFPDAKDDAVAARFQAKFRF